MAVRAATDGHNSIPPDGDEGLGSVIDTATAVIDGQGRVLLWSAVPGGCSGMPQEM